MLTRIQSSLDSLAPAEQNVALLLLEDPRGFCNSPIAALASKAKVSKPTVVRFCRRLGYEGLSDFKLKLASSIGEGVPFIHRDVSRQDSADAVLAKVCDNTVAALLKYRNDASAQTIRRVAEVLQEAEHPLCLERVAEHGVPARQHVQRERSVEVQEVDVGHVAGQHPFREDEHEALFHRTPGGEEQAAQRDGHHHGHHRDGERAGAAQTESEPAAEHERNGRAGLGHGRRCY